MRYVKYDGIVQILKPYIIIKIMIQTANCVTKMASAPTNHPCPSDCRCSSNFSTSSLTLSCEYRHHPSPDTILVDGCQSATLSFGDNLKIIVSGELGIPNSTVAIKSGKKSPNTNSKSADYKCPTVPLFAALRSLRTLDVSHNNIQRGGSPLSHWTRLWSGTPNLTFLNISGNGLRDLPPETFVDIPWLQNLDASYNSFEEISPHVWNLAALLVLNLSHNHIYRIGQESLAHLPSLIILSLEGNDISTLDYPLFPSSIPEFGYHPYRIIDSISLRDNKLFRIKMNVFSGISINGTLDISNNKLSKVPTSALKTMGHIETLWISGNCFTIIGPYTFYDMNLSKLRITHSKHLKLIHDFALVDLPRLTNLKISHNRHLHSISAHSLTHLPQLEELDLSHNNLVQVPKSFADHLASLGYLDIRHNPIICNCQSKWILKALERRDMIISIDTNDTLSKCFAHDSIIDNPGEMADISANFSIHNQNSIIPPSHYPNLTTLLNYTLIDIDEPLINFEASDDMDTDKSAHRAFPSIVTEYLSPEVDLEIGDKVLIPCKAMGCPNPIISWTLPSSKAPLKPIVFTNYLPIFGRESLPTQQNPNPNVSNSLARERRYDCQTNNASSVGYYTCDFYNKLESEKFMNLDGNLLINFVEPVDAGIYRCVVEDGKRKVITYDVRIKVNKPRLTLTPVKILPTSIILSTAKANRSDDSYATDLGGGKGLGSSVYRDKTFYTSNYDTFVGGIGHFLGLYGSGDQGSTYTSKRYFVIYGPVKDVSRRLISSFKNPTVKNIRYPTTSTTIADNALSSSTFVLANTQLIKKRIDPFGDNVVRVNKLRPGTLYEFCLGLESVVNNADSVPTNEAGDYKVKVAAATAPFELSPSKIMVINCFQVKTAPAHRKTRLRFSGSSGQSSGIGKRYALILTIALSILSLATAVGLVCFKRLYQSLRLKRLALKSEKLSQQLFLDNMDLDDRASEKICEEIRLTFENPFNANGAPTSVPLERSSGIQMGFPMDVVNSEFI